MFEFLQKLLGKTQTWDGSDRRHMVRCRCNLELLLQTPQCCCRVRDLGQGGLRLDCPAEQVRGLRMGANLEFRPADQDLKPVKGKVCWLKTSGSTTRIGLRFASPLPGTWMQKWIDDVAGQSRQKRRHIRVRTDWVVQAVAGNRTSEARLRDLSVTGCRFESSDSFVVGESVRLKMANMDINAEVRRITGNGNVQLVGVRFDSKEPETQQLVALLRKLAGG